MPFCIPLLAYILSFAVSCKAKKVLPLPMVQSSNSSTQDDEADAASNASAVFKWYSFIDGDIVSTDLPRLSPPQGKKPWTEAVRIASMCGTEGDGSEVASAYALVNHLGIIEMKGKDMTLHQDASVFSSRTVGPLAFCRGDNIDVPIFSVYRNTLFNDMAGKTDALHQFLVQFDPATHIFYPVISCNNLSLDNNSEVVDFVWDGEEFVCSVKNVQEVNDTPSFSQDTKPHTRFSYISIRPKAPLPSITPQDKDAITVSSTTKEAYRSLRMTQPFSAAPKRLKSLLDFLDGRVSFIVTCYTVSGNSPRGYTSECGGSLLNAYAILGDSYVAAMFSDGTTYLTGSLTGISIRDTIAFRLPLLPNGWAYTSFAISGAHLYAAWEETNFYETGRSGLISVDLAKVLKN